MIDLVPRQFRRMATCVHEAGHTTSNLVSGLAFVKVRIITDNSGVVINRAGAEGCELEEGVSFAAGLAAERIWAMRDGGEHAQQLYDDAFGPAEHDSRWVVHYARHARVPVVAMRRLAHAQMLANWGAVMRTARALMKSPTMSYSRTKSVARV